MRFALQHLPCIEIYIEKIIHSFFKLSDLSYLHIGDGDGNWGKIKEETEIQTFISDLEGIHVISMKNFLDLYHTEGVTLFRKPDLQIAMAS